MGLWPFRYDSVSDERFQCTNLQSTVKRFFVSAFLCSLIDYKAKSWRTAQVLGLCALVWRVVLMVRSPSCPTYHAKLENIRENNAIGRVEIPLVL